MQRSENGGDAERWGAPGRPGGTRGIAGTGDATAGTRDNEGSGAGLRGHPEVLSPESTEDTKPHW